ncbi:hypothetical protein DGo_PB0260 (plasmid) [Deinococcus gobiensis I-0]|uniref:Uncharacterized protein n=2 Tax=Deinococcus TaxID=1298 RepID=H8H1Y2_DEIGI|nr:hypothetical protein DGo_PB0260 [Deinococcus gobiensis I-0]
MSYGPQFLSPEETATILQTPVQFTPQEGGTLHAALLIPTEGEAELSGDSAALSRHLGQGQAALIVQGRVQVTPDTDHSGELELLVDTVIVVTANAECRALAAQLTEARDARLRARIKLLILQVLAQMKVYAS